jgi:hypothetical protein
VLRAEMLAVLVLARMELVFLLVQMIVQQTKENVQVVDIELVEVMILTRVLIGVL